MKPYENSSLITKFDVEEKAHIEVDPVYGDAILQAKRVRDKIKDDFKEQDKMVKDFLSEYDLEENPKLPKNLNNEKALKDMKLAERYNNRETFKESTFTSRFDDRKVVGKTWDDFISNIESQTNFDVDAAYKDNPDQWIELIDKNTGKVFDAEVTPYSDGSYELMLYNIEKKEDLNDRSPEAELENRVANYLENKIMDFINDNIPAQQVAADVPGYDANYCPEEPTSNIHKVMLKISFLVEKISRLLLNIYFGEELKNDPNLIENLTSTKLTEASISDMINAFENKIDELENKNESLTESDKDTLGSVEDFLNKMAKCKSKAEVEKLVIKAKGNPNASEAYKRWKVQQGLDESLQESVSLKEDYSNFIGKPLKDFLNTLSPMEKLNIDYEEVAQGTNGMMGRQNQVPWYVADRIVKDIQLGDENYYKFKILTESITEDKKKEITEARKVSKLSYADDDEAHRYKVVAADTDAKELFVKDVKGLGKVDKLLAELTDEKLNDMGATQLYVTRDDNKEIYLKFGNDDGSWDLIQDEREMEKPAEERDTLFNHVVADLNSESTPDQKALRNIPRKGEGYVGFENDEIGFKDDVFHLKSQSDKPISWAKKVADYYGFKTSEVKLGQNNYKYIDIFAPGIGDDPKLV